MTISKIVVAMAVTILLAACIGVVLIFNRVKKSLEEEKKAARKNSTL